MTKPIPLNIFETDEDLLAFDIALGLKKAKVGKMEVCQRHARKVVEQLKLSGWEFRRGPETPAH